MKFPIRAGALRSRLGAFLGAFLLLGTLIPGPVVANVTTTGSAVSGALAVRLPRAPRLIQSADTAAPTDVYCLQTLGVPCYSPQQMQTAYGVTPVLNKGYNGAGQTIVIIDSIGSPTILSDLQTFDAGYGLPDPPSFQVLAPLGAVTFDPTNSTDVGWAFEISLDVEWAHAMAPGANIILMTSPVAETEGVQGLPEFASLERQALDQHLGQIISQSWGATEETLGNAAGQQAIHSLEAVYHQAASQHVTVLASAGDQGVANYDISSVTTYPYPTVIYPASSAWVTAVGGTSLTAGPNGVYQSEVVWNDGQPSNGATGGGVSASFAEPPYQINNLPSSVQSTLQNHRGLPDVAYNADPYTSILVYTSFLPGAAGYYLIGGTSEGSPQWAGIIADGNQMAGRSLGFLNPALYLIGASSQSANFHDITSGNNGQGNLTGYSATAGWDLTTGWGSPQAATLLKSLIAATQ